MDRANSGGQLVAWSGEHAGRRCTHARLRITGLTCAAETVKIERRLFREPGVINVTVNPITEIAYVIYDPERTHLSTLRRAIMHAGFGAEET